MTETYVTENEPDFTIEITDDDINAEQKKAQYKVCLGGWLEVFIKKPQEDSRFFKREMNCAIKI